MRGEISTECQESIEMKTYTQQQAAVILQTDSESVFNRMMGRFGALLPPSINLKTPILMQRTVSSGGNPDDYGRGATTTVVEETLSGVFGVEGIRPLEWNELGLAQITFGEWPPDPDDQFEQNHRSSSGVLLSHGEYMYTVKSRLKITRNDLVVTEADLLQYGRQIIGVTFELPLDEPKPMLADAQPDPPTTHQAKARIRLPRHKFYTPHGLAEYWRNELEVKVTDSDVDHYVEVGLLKTSVRYRTRDGYWWDEDDPDLISKFNPLNFQSVHQKYQQPPIRELFIRLEEAERFEKEYFRTAESKPALTEEAYKSATTATTHSEFASDKTKQSNSDNSINVDDYLANNPDAPIGEKVYWLRVEAHLENQEIGDLLNIGTNDPRSKSRKQKVQDIYKAEAVKLGTWENVKRKGRKEKILTPNTL
jgi:hypothetical protein